MKMIDKSIINWLERIVVNCEEPSQTVIAYNIGLFEADKGYCAYFIGSDWYDANNDDWACDQTFTPVERYLVLESVKSFNWESVQQIIVETVTLFLTLPESRDTFLGRAQAVTVGFEDGSLIRIK